MTVRDRKSTRVPVKAPPSPKAPSAHRPRLVRWLAWVVVLLVAVAVLVAVLPETTPEPVALADLNPGENPEVFGLEAEVAMIEGSITVTGIENPELSGLSARLPIIVTVPAPTGPSLREVSPYGNPELYGAAAVGFTTWPALRDFSVYDNPELLGPGADTPLVLQSPAIDPHESPEVLRAALPVLIPLWLVSS